MPRTLQQYIADELARGFTDFRVRAMHHEGTTTFYIHPADRGGDTLDFAVEGNELRTMSDCRTQPEPKA